MAVYKQQGNVVGYTICPVCGKLFYVTSSDWAYRRVVRFKHEYLRTEYYCKWSCLRERERQVQAEHTKIIQEAVERRTRKQNATLRQKRMDKRKLDSTQ